MYLEGVQGADQIMMDMQLGMLRPLLLLPPVCVAVVILVVLILRRHVRVAIVHCVSARRPLFGALTNTSVGGLKARLMLKSH